jgi:hypothetical protein
MSDQRAAQQSMTRLSLYRRAVAVLLVLWLTALGWVLHSRYRADHPATTPYVAGKCTAAGLVGHWKFDEVAGGSTPDAGPYGHHGRLALAPRAFAPLRFSPPALVPGPRGNALQFGGKQWVTVANNDCFATEQFTVAAWVWLEEAHGVPTIAAKSAASTDGWWLCTTSLGAQEAERYLDFGIAVGGGRIAHVKSGFQLPLRELTARRKLLLIVDEELRLRARVVERRDHVVPFAQRQLEA